MNVSPEQLDAVCEGCLSPDRQRITEVTDFAIKKVFYEILNETVQAQSIESKSLRLCTECVASIQRFLAFKQQVREATETLNRHLLKYNLPKISSIESVSARPQEPLAFIKVEDADDDQYYDDGCRDVDDKELKVVLKTDLEKPNKLKLSRNKNIEDDFDASDEEPLKNKKRGDGRRDKKRKRENDSAAKIDRRKYPAPKKEKPSGVVNNPRVSRKLQQLSVAPGQLEMLVLSWDEVEAERVKARSSESFTRHEYQCHDCVVGFNHKFKLTNHMNKHEPVAGAAPQPREGPRRARQVRVVREDLPRPHLAAHAPLHPQG